MDKPLRYVRPLARRRWLNKQLARRITQALRLDENGILLLLAILVGLGTGIGVLAFRRGIVFFQTIFVDRLANDFLGEQLGLGDFGIVLALGSAGFLVGLTVHFFLSDEKHSSMATIIQAVALLGGRLPYEKMPFKAVASALSIGASSSLGPEDPSVQIGSNLGSFVGQNLGLSEERVRLLVAAGAASAIASAFHAPIAGVFFALEIVLGNFATGAVGVVVLSSVMGSVFTQSVEPGGAELGIRTYELGGPYQIPFFFMLGVLSAPIAVGFIRTVYWQNDLWKEWNIPIYAKTAFAGVVVGLVGVFFPQILGAGRGTMNEVLNTGSGEFTISLLLALMLAKYMMTSVSIAGGFVGGVFAPSLFIGAMFGGAYGRAINSLLPNLEIGDPAAYAIAGMAAMMAGIIRAPITAILLIFELTNNYQLILPIMLATVVTVFLADRFEPESIYTKALKRAGIHIQQGRDVDVMQSVMVREVMHVPPPMISPKATLSELRDAFRQQQTKALCVVEDRNDKQTLVGVVALADLQTAYETAQEANFEIDLLVEDICIHDVITITPDEPVFEAIKRMGQFDIGHLPVLATDYKARVVGFLTRNDVMRSYNIAVTRKWESQYQQQQIRLKNLVNEEVFTVRIPTNANVANKEIREIGFPSECVVVSIRRGNKTVLPHGHTVLKAGDRLTLVGAPAIGEKVKGLLTAPSLESLGLEV